MLVFSVYTWIKTAFPRADTEAFASTLLSWLPGHISAHEVIRPLHGCAKRQHCMPGTEEVASLARRAYTTLAHPCITNQIDDNHDVPTETMETMETLETSVPN